MKIYEPPCGSVLGRKDVERYVNMFTKRRRWYRCSSNVYKQGPCTAYRDSAAPDHAHYVSLFDYLRGYGQAATLCERKLPYDYA